MEILPTKHRASRPGPADWMTGAAWIDEIAGPRSPGAARVVRVTFSPGARTHWHTHPRGQILHVLAGAGLVQKRGEPVLDITPGDTVLIAPGEEHWHGARADQLMTHLAVQETGDDGQTTLWLEPVSAADYGG